jgi:hypothetical protein
MTTAICSAVAAPLAKIFAINDDIVGRAVDGLTDEQLWTRLTERNNPMLWIVGHFVHTRVELLALLGERIDTGWGDRFARGAAVGDRAWYPPREDVRRVLNNVSRRLQGKLATLDDEQLRRAPAIAVPGAETLADGIAGFALHDCYHAGQMGYIRKALGYPALAG